MSGMKVAFQLRRRPGRGQALALLLPTRDADALLGLCARLGLDPAGRVHNVSGGLLLTLDDPTTRPTPGAVRLRALAANLFLPADADLIPALLDDEAEGLARDRGLIFLPGGQILGFDPKAPLDPSALLSATQGPRRAWKPLPRPTLLADRIEEIVIDWPVDQPESILDAGNESIGTEEPRPADSSAAARIAGNAALGAGRGMVWLGQTLGLQGLARLGAEWIKGAMGIAPRLSETVLGRQAAALRSLLQEFREGDPERALRRALPLSEPGGPRGAGTAVGDQLPNHDLSYSLNKLLEPAGRGTATGVWHGGHDLFTELTQEYRKAAEKAIRGGDHRRAAFIYGRLLRDYREAAHALLRGGLHHDAAVLLLAKLDDRREAARAFEAAGEFDRAVELYRQMGEHVEAGDLLRRIGEEDAALAEFFQAASRLATAGRGHLAAGELLLAKTGRSNLAMAYFYAGWARRPDGNAIPCALRMAKLHAEANDVAAFHTLLDQADAFFAPPGNDHAAGQFYNEVARLARQESLGEAREALRERALMGLAYKLRQLARPGARPGTFLPTLLGRHGTWPASVVSDASFAVAAATRTPPEERKRPPVHSSAWSQRFRVGVGVVTAVTSTPESGEVFLGFAGGEVYCFRPELSEVVLVASYHLPVAALGVDPDGSSLVVLRAGAGSMAALSTYARLPDGSFRNLLGTTVADVNEPWLTPILPGESDDFVGLWDGTALKLLTVATLNSWGITIVPNREPAPSAALLVARPRGDDAEPAVLLNDGLSWSLINDRTAFWQRSPLSWRPWLPDDSHLMSVPLSWLSRASDRDHLEMAGLGPSGNAHWARLNLAEEGFQMLATNVQTRAGGYLAAALVRSGLIAAVSPTRIEWLRGGAERFTLVAASESAIPSAVACAGSRRTGELIVVCGDGYIARIPSPV
jgi:tetratricopeptide (TPR) repeat protein